MVGRYEDAVKMLERLTRTTYNEWRWVVRSSSLAGLVEVDGRKPMSRERSNATRT